MSSLQIRISVKKENKKKKKRIANRVDPEEMAHYEPPLLDLHCLLFKHFDYNSEEENAFWVGQFCWLSITVLRQEKVNQSVRWIISKADLRLTNI